MYFSKCTRSTLFCPPKSTSMSHSSSALVSQANAARNTSDPVRVASRTPKTERSSSRLQWKSKFVGEAGARKRRKIIGKGVRRLNKARAFHLSSSKRSILKGVKAVRAIKILLRTRKGIIADAKIEITINIIAYNLYK